MGNAVISSAILDRLLHHNHVLNIREEICRPKEKRQAGLLPPTDCQPLPLGSFIAGRVDPGDDVDFFKLDLFGEPGHAHVSIYTTGDLDTFGALYDSNGDSLTYNRDVTSGEKSLE